MTTLPPFARLIGEVAAPVPGMTVYDPTAGVGMLLRAVRDATRRRADASESGLLLFGQELDPVAFAIGRASFTRSSEKVEFVRGDTLRAPAFVDDEQLRRFDVVVANPVWEQRVASQVYQEDPFGRFGFGVPPGEYADWGWVQHCLASTNDTGRAVVILDAGALHRGAESNGDPEAEIRRAILAADLVEAVIWCVPDDPIVPIRAFDARLSRALAQSAVIVLNRQKRVPGQVQLIDAASILRSHGLVPGLTLDAIARAYHTSGAAPGVTLRDTEQILATGGDLRPSRCMFAAA